MKEENVLFNDILNTFYLWLYGVKTYGKEPYIIMNDKVFLKKHSKLSIMRIKLFYTVK